MSEESAAGALGASALAAPVIKGMLDSFAKTIPGKVSKLAKIMSDRAVASLQLGFEPYLTTTYNKCKIFKSILAPGKPQQVIEKYVSVNLRCHDEIMADIDIISGLYEKRRIVITGLAGSGKSMFMKYLCVHKFIYPDGTIPLFVELRQLNDLSVVDLVAFVRSSTVSKRNNITEEQFLLALESGAFVIILDGFDELNHDIRDSVQSQILRLETDYPQATVVVSSRPDPRFGSWSSYHVFNVQPLDLDQTLTLINHLEYDAGVKRRFAKAVKEKLFETHTSFLSSPLLTSIMLLTFEEFAEIPQRMHEFYSQAFDTLLQKHDAQKEQYQRKTHTNLTREEFRACFSAFCAISYVDEKFAFNDDDLISHAENAIKYVRQTSVAFKSKISPRQFVDDLRESVCMLQPDGNEMTFVHRSFQEYFTALFVTSLHGERVGRFLDRCALRYEDSVIPMAADMAREVVEKEWALSAVEAVLNHDVITSENSGKAISSVFSQIMLFTNWVYVTMRADVADPLIIGYIESLAALYPKRIPRNVLSRPLYFKERADVLATVSEAATGDLPRADDLKVFLGNVERPNGKGKGIKAKIEVAEYSINEGDAWWLDALGYGTVRQELKIGLQGILKDIGGREKRRASILEDILN